MRGLSHTLGRAFYEDPIMMWVLPDAARRAKSLPHMFATMTRHHFLAGGGAEIATNTQGVGAAALWDPPGRWKRSRREELRMTPGFVRAFGLRVGAGREVSDLVKKIHPQAPHWYLAVIGSDPTVRGGGFGQALMRSRLDRCDAEHAPAYLEVESNRTASVLHTVRLRGHRRNQASRRRPQHVADVAGAALAPAVLRAQSRGDDIEHLPVHDGALTTDPFLRDVKDSVQPHRNSLAPRNPAAAADADAFGSSR